MYTNCWICRFPCLLYLLPINLICLRSCQNLIYHQCIDEEDMNTSPSGFNSSCNHCHVNQTATMHRDPDSPGNAAEPQQPRSHLQALTFTWGTERKHICNDAPCQFLHHPPLISKHQAWALSGSESSQDLGTGFFSLKG